MVVAGFDVPHAHVHLIPMEEYHDITSRPLREGDVESASIGDLQLAAARINRNSGAARPTATPSRLCAADAAAEEGRRASSRRWRLGTTWRGSGAEQQVKSLLITIGVEPRPGAA